MSATRTVGVTTKHEVFGDIETKFDITVPASFEEACGEEFFGNEEKAIDALQAAVQQRKMNAARAVLREAEEKPADWNEFARNIAENYTPGRRGGFAAPVEESALDAAGSVEEIKALLRAKGIKLV